MLYISAMERASALFSFFGRTKYCQWTPKFLQYCYQLRDEFPLFYDSYMIDGFIMNTTKKGYGVPFDQALEQCHNWPAKVSGGIIGVTRKKDGVALWEIIKHKKDQYVDLLMKNNDIQEELSFRHDFNPNTTTMIVSMVRDIEQYLLKVCNLLLDQTVLNNILMGEVVTNVEVNKLIRCMREGREAYTRFLSDRSKKLLSIHSTISKIKFAAPKAILNQASKLDIKGETIKALMFIEYASHRGCTIYERLQHEITNSAFFLMYENGYLRRSVKSQLGTKLLELCPLIH